LSYLPPTPMEEIDLFRRRLPILVGLNVFGSLTGDDDEARYDEVDRFRVVVVSYVLARY
jgi:hypothetical protein